jgi:hypothetical protein
MALYLCVSHCLCISMDLIHCWFDSMNVNRHLYFPMEVTQYTRFHVHVIFVFPCASRDVTRLGGVVESGCSVTN